jgi:hypothetical protein
MDLAQANLGCQGVGTSTWRMRVDAPPAVPVLAMPGPGRPGIGSGQATLRDGVCARCSDSSEVVLLLTTLPCGSTRLPWNHLPNNRAHRLAKLLWLATTLPGLVGPGAGAYVRS